MRPLITGSISQESVNMYKFTYEGKSADCVVIKLGCVIKCSGWQALKALLFRKSIEQGIRLYMNTDLEPSITKAVEATWRQITKPIEQNKLQ